jgi:hypothetical protein
MVSARSVERREKKRSMNHKKGKCQHNTKCVCVSPKPESKLDTIAPYVAIASRSRLLIESACRHKTIIVG